MRRMHESERAASIISYDLSYPMPCPHCGTWMNNAPAAATHLAKKHDDYSRVTKEVNTDASKHISRCNNCYAKVSSSKRARCTSCGINPSVTVGKRKQRPF